VRFGDRVYSPIVETGEADLIVSFEKIEAARWLPQLKPSGVIVVNTQQVDPMPVIVGAAEYPAGVLEEMTAAGAKVDAIDALTLAEQAGSSKAANIVLMGRVAKYFDIPYDQWLAAIEKTVAPKFVELNKRAFELGYHA
jgi:indolepyruvate ferredoxin oxidoreductase beta subunit